MWYYNKKAFSDDMIPEGAVGFIYMMRLQVNGVTKFYIGKKLFYSTQKVKFGKKAEALRTDKRLKNYKEVRKLSYQNYYSSNATIKEARKKGEVITRVMLKICYSKMELTYQEVRYQFKMDVLETDVYLNDNILGKFFKNEKVSKIL
jgi:hypothetical protein